MQWTEDQIASAVRAMQQDYGSHMRRLQVRRALIDMYEEATSQNGTGTHLVPPFDKSALIIQTLIGEPVREVQRYSSRISANQPQPVVIPVSVDRNVTKTMSEQAAEQERLLAAMWDAAKGAELQRKVAWSQSWGRVGYYLTLPRDATWGLPDREYYDDLTDDEIEMLKARGKLSASQLEDPRDGRMKYAESAESWLERRRKAAADVAVAGKSLNTLEALPPDVVYVRRDSEGIKWAAIVQEAPASDFQAGTDMAKALARRMNVDEEEIDRFGMYLDEHGRVQGGVTEGAEPHNAAGQTWTFVRFITRSDVYYMVSGQPDLGGGKIVYHDEHGDGVVPLVPVPFAETDSLRPGSEYTCPFEAVAAYAPLINQIETLLSNVAAWNALPRWVIEQKDGTLVRDENGEPLMLKDDPTVGLDPSEAQVLGGTVKQLVIDATLLLQLLQVYQEQLDKIRLPDVAVGAAGTSGPAWTAQLQIAQSQIDLSPAVNNHAKAVEQVMKIWVNRARKLDVPIYMFSLPGHRRDDKTRRGLIEFDPANLTEALVVTQDSNTARDRIVAKQAGQEELSAGLIDMRQYYEEYAAEPDPEEAVLRAYTHRVAQYVLTGDTTQIMPGSVLYAVAEAVRGRLTLEMYERAPNMAIAKAQQMAQSATANSIQPIGEGGNQGQAQGVVLGQQGAARLPGSPEMGAANAHPRPNVQAAGVQ